MDAPKILEILDARCGDMLKAYVLRQFYPDLDINLLMVRQPVGDAEAAFAAARASSSEAPASHADRLMQDFKTDHGKKAFQDIDPVAEAKKSAGKVIVVDGKPQWQKEAAEPTDVGPSEPTGEPADGEFDVDGRIFVTREVAAKMRGCLETSITVAAINGKWTRISHPEDGRKSLFLKADVLLRKRGRVSA